MPSLTHWMPVRAGTMLSFIDSTKEESQWTLICGGRLGRGGNLRDKFNASAKLGRHVRAIQSQRARDGRPAGAAPARNGVGSCGLQHGGIARQVEVPQARDPEAQRARRAAWPAAAARSAAASGRTRAVGAQEGRGPLGVVGAGGQVDAPVVQAHGDVEQPAVDAGEVEIEEAGEAAVLEHHVVAEQVGMDRAARQGGVGRAGGDVVLVGQLARAAARPALGSRRAAPPARSRSTRPGRAGWAGCADSRAPARCMRASISPTAAQCAASGASSLLAAQLVHHRRGLAADRVQDLGHRGRPRWRSREAPAARAPGCRAAPGASSGAGRTAAARTTGARTASARIRRRSGRSGSSWCSRCRLGCRAARAARPGPARAPARRPRPPRLP